MTHTSIATEVEIFKRIRAEIAEAFKLEEDDDALLDTVEGETDLVDTLATLMREARAAASKAEGMKALIKEMQDRKARLEAKAARIRAIVLNAMTDADLPKLSPPDMTVSRQWTKAPVVVPDEAAVPEAFCRIKREPDKTKIAEALKAGAALDFAYYGNPSQTLVLRGS